MRRASVRALTAALAGGALLLPAAVPASAGQHHGSRPADPRTIATGFAGPLGLAVGSHGKVYVAQSFSGTLTKLRNGVRTDIASEPGSDISGVAVGRNGRVAYTVTTFSGDPESGGSVVSAYVKRIGRDGTARIIADTWAYEQKHNPDAGNSYGFQGLDAECAAQVPAEVGGGEPYSGQLDSHAYKLTALRDGSYLVADAGANDVLHVWPNGKIRTVAVLPPQPLTVTPEMAAGLGLPECAIGHDYNFEPVPTDVEVGPRGALYVTTLPGGPEDPSLGARGKVYKITVSHDRHHRYSRHHGHSGHHGYKVREVASGLLGAVDLDVNRHGKIYVAELFGNRISTIRHGSPVTFAEVTNPATVELANGKLYATTDAFGAGAVVSFRL